MAQALFDPYDGICFFFNIHIFYAQPPSVSKGLSRDEHHGFFTGQKYILMYTNYSNSSFYYFSYQYFKVKLLFFQCCLTTSTPLINLIISS